MIEQPKLHSILPAVHGERTALAPCPPADCDRLMVGENGCYIRPPAPPRDSASEVRRYEALAAEYGDDPYKKAFYLGYASQHRARLAQRQQSLEDLADAWPESAEECAHVGVVTAELALQD